MILHADGTIIAVVIGEKGDEHIQLRRGSKYLEATIGGQTTRVNMPACVPRMLPSPNETFSRRLMYAFFPEVVSTPSAFGSSGLPLATLAWSKWSINQWLEFHKNFNKKYKVESFIWGNTNPA
jgi:hypothetical protein